MVVRKCGGVVTWVGGIGRRADYEELSGVEESCSEAVPSNARVE